MENTDQREKFITETKVLAAYDDDYLVLAEANQYEVEKVTPERPNQDGSMNPGAVLLMLENGDERWIPRSVLAIDEDETLYIQDWYFNKHF